jgi:hypothetical protein
MVHSKWNDPKKGSLSISVQLNKKNWSHYLHIPALYDLNTEIGVESPCCKYF